MVSSPMEGGDPTTRREKRRPKVYERNQEMGRDERALMSLECGRVCTGAGLPPATPHTLPSAKGDERPGDVQERKKARPARRAHCPKWNLSLCYAGQVT